MKKRRRLTSSYFFMTINKYKFRRRARKVWRVGRKRYFYFFVEREEFSFYILLLLFFFFSFNMFGSFFFFSLEKENVLKLQHTLSTWYLNRYYYNGFFGRSLIDVFFKYKFHVPLSVFPLEYYCLFSGRNRNKDVGR
jgi:hypothetical protein